MWFYRFFFCLTLLSFSHHGSEGACYFEPSVVGMVDGRPTAHCEHEGKKYSPGESFKPGPCLECLCMESGQRCCRNGTGPVGGFLTPEGCKKISHNCVSHIVKVEDETLDCITGHPITFGRK